MHFSHTKICNCSFMISIVILGLQVITFILKKYVNATKNETKQNISPLQNAKRWKLHFPVLY